MSYEGTGVFTKENLDTLLKELAKEFKRRNGTAVPAEIILIGGAAVLAGYGFREMTTDVDAVIHASSAMKEAAGRVGDKYNLPHGWLNSDFMRTDSYSPRLEQFSVYYKTFSNVLQVRTVSAEYLIAMKLRSGRKYKNDLSDIIGILAEHENRGNPISKDKIDMAVCNLYGSWDGFPADSVSFINNALERGSYEAVYAAVIAEERNSKDLLVQFGEKYPGVTTQSNVNEILASLKARTPSLIGQLRESREQRGRLSGSKEPSENKELSADNASERQPKNKKEDTAR